MDRTLKLALASLMFNMAYSAYHITFGVTTRSWWFFSVGIYYAILSIIRFTVLRHKRNECFLVRFTGIMLMVLSFSLVGTVILAFVKDRGTVFHLIAMLALAVYAFTKITLATIKWIKARKSTSVKMLALRNISFADAFVSIFSLQRSMLVSFEGMSEIEIRIMNAATGSAVCVIVFLLGLNLVRKKTPFDL
jgi:divalent metal cation (Fe/Co/Zn/Cd) transporter